MRRIIPVLISVFMVLGLIGCGRQEAKADLSEKNIVENNETAEESETDTKEASEEPAAETKEASEEDSVDMPEADLTEEAEEPESKTDTEENKFTVKDDFEVSGLKDDSAAGLFKEFLLGRGTAEYNGDMASLRDLFMLSFDEYGFDSENETMAENIAENYAIHFTVSDASEPTLYIEIMNVMVAGTVYQIRIKEDKLYINSVLETGWSDSVSVYTNGILGIYHGMHLPTVDYYFDATDKMIDIFDGSSKAKLLIFGPKSYFDTDFEEALSGYEEQAEKVLVFDEELTEDITAERDKLLGISDNDAKDWTKLEILDC